MFLFICVHIIRGIVGQLSETSNILAHRQRALLQILEFLLL
jgi:hypothetical protein